MDGEDGSGRVQLINPVVRRLCEAVAKGEGADLFSVYEPLIAGRGAAPDPNASPWAEVTVVDLSWEEASLGDVVSEGGAAYQRVDVSSFLARRARKLRALAGGKRADRDVVEAARLRKAFGPVTAKTIVTCVIVLEHLRRADTFLAQLANVLGECDHDVPVLIMTMAKTDDAAPLRAPSTKNGAARGRVAVGRPRFQREWELLFRESRALRPRV